jgi:hypothetical protein
MLNPRPTVLSTFSFLLLATIFTWVCQAAGKELDKGFATPPSSAKPWVYWFWLDGNITREGITADIEAMHRVGIGGVLIMEVSTDMPQGPVAFASPQWRELFRYACSEARRLDMQVNMNNDAGWCGSAGPWITPDKSMQKVVWTETVVAGPSRFDKVLAEPERIKGYYRDIAVLAIPESGVAPIYGFDYRIPNIRWKAVFEVSSTLHEFPYMPAEIGSLPPAFSIPHGRIKDLTPQCVGGHLTWDVPPGKWTVLRFGHTSTGRENHPAPASGCGLECDRLSTEGIDSHFDALIGKLVKDLGPLAKDTLVSTHIDSWESGGQNWTPRFRTEFQRRRGYDPLLYLPTLTGRCVDSLEVSERFLWDFRQTLGELLLDNYAGRLRMLANRHGLRLSIEGYDNDFCDNVAYAGRADEPMSEFWNGIDPGVDNRIGRSWVWCADMTSAAHVYGRPIVAAESFTSMWWEKWLDHPGTIKTLGDWALCEGINRFVFHRYALQPWLGRKPGIAMGPWGLHYERTQTWWEMSKPWHEYLARCQLLLRQGLFVADLCYLQPEGAPMRFQPPGNANTLTPPDRPGYNFDGCTPEVVLTRMSVKDGRLVLPDGMSYRALVLPEPGLMPGALTMTPRLLAKIKSLVELGAMVIGPRPFRSPSLESYPDCDAQVKRLADSLWGDYETADTLLAAGKPGLKRLGKGLVVWGVAPTKALADNLALPPDFVCTTRPVTVRYTHRHASDGTDFYFVANKTKAPTSVVCEFRIHGRRPELWRPETGRIEYPAMYDEREGRVVLPLQLDSAESVFVVFRADTPIESDRIASITELDGDNAIDRAAKPAIRLVRDGDEVLATIPLAGTYQLQMANGKVRRVETSTVPGPLQVDGPWELRFPSSSELPEKVILDKLISWAEHPDPRIKYFSGTVTYHKTIDLPPDVPVEDIRRFLDLGNVQVMAEVKVNGKNLGILWKSPYRVEITDAVRPGKNDLEIGVVNLWPNRMIGDEQLPEDSQRNPNGALKSPNWPKWLLEGKPSPSSRQTFTTWRLWRKDDALLESGLIGPVKIMSVKTVRVKL